MGAGTGICNFDTVKGFAGAVNKILAGQVTVDVAVVGTAPNQSSNTITIPGAKVGDIVIAAFNGSYPAAGAATTLYAYVSAANTVTFGWNQPVTGAGAFNAASGTYSFIVFSMA